MDPRELRNKELKELEEMKAKLKDAIVEAYLEMRTGKEDDVRKPRRMRKDFAVLCTVIAEKKANLKEKQQNG